MTFTLDYDRWIHLDAEDLAETGIGDAYDRLLPEMRQYIQQPAPVEETIDSEAACYTVRCGSEPYVIYSRELDARHGNGWGRATFAFFRIVNEQLIGSEYRFYAINGGNDLGGMFLTPTDAKAAQQSLPNPTDWPYLPSDDPPWYGQYH